MSTPEDMIRSVVPRVAHDIDAKRWGQLRTLFATEVDTDYTSLFGGEPARQSAEALVLSWQKMLGEISTQHLLGPIVLTLSDDTATAECHVHAFHQGRGSEWVVLGHYDFALKKAGSKWLISRMKLVTFHERGTRKVIQPDAK